MLWRECRNSLILKLVLCRCKCITNRIYSRIKNTNDISCISFLNHLTLIRHHLLWLCKLDCLTTLNMIDLHTSSKLTRTDTHKCNTVTMILVHVCLNLKYKSGKIFRKWIYHSNVCLTSHRRIRHLQKVLQKGLHTEVRQRRSEKHRRKLTLCNLLHIKLSTSPIQKLNFIK